MPKWNGFTSEVQNVGHSSERLIPVGATPKNVSDTKRIAGVQIDVALSFFSMQPHRLERHR